MVTRRSGMHRQLAVGGQWIDAAEGGKFGTAGLPTGGFRLSRRSMLGAGAAGIGTLAAGCAPAGKEQAPAQPGFQEGGVQLVTLGTAAGPPTEQGHMGIASVLHVHGRNYVIDCGRSAVTQYNRMGLRFDTLDSMFITHLHADHVADYYNFFMLAGWGPGDGDNNGAIRSEVQVYGPGPAGALPPPTGGGEVATVAPENPTPGLSTMTQRLIEAYAYSTNVFLRDSGIPDVRDLINVHEIAVPNVGADPLHETAPLMQPFPVAEDDRVRVSAVLVPHGPVFPSFAFRFDTDKGSVVFSGDTSKSRNVVRLAADADVLVHEAIDLDFYRQAGVPPTVLSHLEHSHTPAPQAGQVAAEAGVRTLVLSHLAPGATGTVPDGQWISKAKKHFSGRVIRAHELESLQVH